MKAHGLSTQTIDNPTDDFLLSMNAAQVTAYLALQDEVKKLRKTIGNVKIENLRRIVTQTMRQTERTKSIGRTIRRTRQHTTADATALNGAIPHKNAK